MIGNVNESRGSLLASVTIHLTVEAHPASEVLVRLRYIIQHPITHTPHVVGITEGADTPCPRSLSISRLTIPDMLHLFTVEPQLPHLASHPMLHSRQRGTQLTTTDPMRGLRHRHMTIVIHLLKLGTRQHITPNRTMSRPPGSIILTNSLPIDVMIHGTMSRSLTPTDTVSLANISLLHDRARQM